MGRGRKGLLLQGRKSKKEYDAKMLFVNNNAFRHLKKDNSIDPAVVDYLRSLRPDEVVKTVFPTTPRL